MAFLGNFTSLSEATLQTEHLQLSAHQLDPKSSSAEAAELAKNHHGCQPRCQGFDCATRRCGISPHPSPSHPPLTHIHKFRGEFEGRCLKAKIPGGAREDEPKIDVDYVSIRIQQDVAVVPVRERGNLPLNFASACTAPGAAALSAPRISLLYLGTK